MDPLPPEPRLTSLMTASFPTVELVTREALTPDYLLERNFQVVSTLGNFAGRLRATAAQFPTRPKSWITVEPARVAALREEYLATAKGRKLIGLSWRHSKDSPQWPAPLDAWLPLLDRPDVMIVALHPGPCEAELVAFAERTGRDLIFDRRADLATDLGGYAAQVQACDQVIAVEDLTAVLAGAMGKPTIKLKRQVDHWWWGTKDAKDPWFAALQTVVAENGVGEAAVAEVLSLMDQRR